MGGQCLLVLIGLKVLVMMNSLQNIVISGAQGLLMLMALKCLIKMTRPQNINIKEQGFAAWSSLSKIMIPGPLHMTSVFLFYSQLQERPWCAFYIMWEPQHTGYYCKEQSYRGSPLPKIHLLSTQLIACCYVLCLHYSTFKLLLLKQPYRSVDL